MPVRERGDAEVSAARHGLFGIQQQVKKYLLQLARIAVNHRQPFGKIQGNGNLRGLELVFQKRQRVANHLIQIRIAKLRCRSTREVKQAVGDFGSTEALLRNLVEHGAEARISLKLF